MRAVATTEPGGPEVLTLTEVDAPTPAPGEVLIAVAAAGVNRADLLQRRGHYPPPPGVSDVIGLEVSGQVAALGAKLRVLLVQTPPSLRLEPQAAAASFTALRAGTDAAIVVEARHASWFTPEADTLLGAHGVTRVIADPPHGEARPTEASPVYFRFHGRPRVYFSNYDDDALNEIARRLRAAAETSETWCIFDNTAEGHAVANALCVQRLLGPRAVRSR